MFSLKPLFFFASGGELKRVQSELKGVQSELKGVQRDLKGVQSKLTLCWPNSTFVNFTLNCSFASLLQHLLLKLAISDRFLGHDTFVLYVSKAPFPLLWKVETVFTRSQKIIHLLGSKIKLVINPITSMQ